MAAHAVSKAGIIALTVALAKEVAEHGITVNAICPGFVDTPVWDDSRGKLAQFIEERQIIKIPIKCEDVASMAYWLASSDTAKLVTGQALSLDGGIVFPTY